MSPKGSRIALLLGAFLSGLVVFLGAIFLVTGLSPGAGVAGIGGAVSLTALGGFISVGSGGPFLASIEAAGGYSKLGAGGAGGSIVARSHPEPFTWRTSTVSPKSVFSCAFTLVLPPP